MPSKSKPVSQPKSPGRSKHAPPTAAEPLSRDEIEQLRNETREAREWMARYLKDKKKSGLSRWQCKHRQCRRRTERMAEIVGIDDWSWRHSSRYGTVMVGLERHSVVDVLDERSLYAQAVREGAPQARQKDGHRIARHLFHDIWSNGQAEGHINRLKILKRAMYGRAGPKLMRARMLTLYHTK